MVQSVSPSRLMHKHAFRHVCVACLMVGVFVRPCLAGVNVLIVAPRTGFDGTGIKTQLQMILNGVGLKGVKVEVITPTLPDQKNLSGWLHDSNNAAQKRWSNLQGKGGTAWDYVVIMENPEVIETFPGWYAQGVHDVAVEVERGNGEAVLLMQWPGPKSSASLDYYREVTYRVGRGRGLKVIPAGLAWEACGKPKGEKQPNSDATYIAAASIYSRLWKKSADESSYTYNDALAKTAFKTVTDNTGAKQYSGPFTSAPNGIHAIAGNQNRVIRIINDGWRSRGFPLETVNNGNNWSLTRKMGLINRITADERRGGSSGLSKGGTPDDQADLHYVASTAIRDTTAKLYVSYLSNYVRNTSATSYGALVKKGYNHDAPSLAKRWNAGDKRIRQLPPYLLVSQIFRHFQSYDKKVVDIHVACKPCYAAYMVTMLTGRCPMVLEDAGTKAYTLQQIGYETAWRFSTLYGRAPGFKTWPENRLRLTGDPTHDATIKVAFALPPKSTVTVTAGTPDAFASVSPKTLTFTPANYNVPQSVAVSVAKDSKPTTPFTVILKTSSEDFVYNDLTQSWKYHVNNRPVADDRKALVFANELTAIRLTGSDPDKESLTYSIARQPVNGTVTLSGSIVAYTPKPGFTGTDQFTFKTKDFSVLSSEATVEITVKPSSPYDRNLLVNGGAELFPFKEFGWTEKGGAWGQSTGKRHEGTAAFSPTEGELAELYQEVNVTGYADAINAGRQSFTFDGHFANSRDKLSVVIECIDAAGKVLSSSAIEEVPNNTQPFANRTVAIKPPANTTVLRVRLISNKARRGRSIQCYYDALSLVAVKSEEK